VVGLFTEVITWIINLESSLFGSARSAIKSNGNIPNFFYEHCRYLYIYTHIARDGSL